MNSISRRGFISRLAGTGVGVAAAAELTACAATGIYVGTIQAGTIAVDLAELVELMGEGNAAVVSAPGLEDPVLVLRHTDTVGETAANSFFAVGTRCTHLGCRVRPAGHILACPCHGSSFDLRGVVLRGPARRPLRRYDLDVDGNTLTISGV